MERILSIDLLRAIGLFMIILAHIGPCPLLFELRAFDVVLMVFVSGLTFSMKKDFNYVQYLINRTLRLIIPTYIFLTVYFLVRYVFLHDVDIRTMFLTYSLINGIGYVWIIRIFLLVMIVAPMIYKITTKLSINQLLLLYAVMFFAVDLLVVFSANTPSSIQKIFTLVVIPLMGYSVPYSIAIKVKEHNDSIPVLLSTILMFLIAAVAIYAMQGNPPHIYPYKYPPRSVYLLYGVNIAVWLYWFMNKIEKQGWLSFSRIPLGGGKIGQNTIWIYFWHIPFVNFVNEYIGIWEIRYIVILCLSISCFAIQYILVNDFNNPFLKRYLVG